jgi:hypothetical protein
MSRCVRDSGSLRNLETAWRTILFSASTKSIAPVAEGPEELPAADDADTTGSIRNRAHRAQRPPQTRANRVPGIRRTIDVDR